MFTSQSILTNSAISLRETIYTDVNSCDYREWDSISYYTTFSTQSNSNESSKPVFCGTED